jgi:hypothetical protein
MARNKELLVKEIKNDLAQALHVLESADVKELTFGEIKTAAASATQAATALHRLAGMLDVEADFPR